MPAPSERNTGSLKRDKLKVTQGAITSNATRPGMTSALIVVTKFARATTNTAITAPSNRSSARDNAHRPIANPRIT